MLLRRQDSKITAAALRGLSYALVFALFYLSVPAPVWASEAKAVKDGVITKERQVHQLMKDISIRKTLRDKAKRAGSVDTKALANAATRPYGPTLLDEAGLLGRAVSVAQLDAWKNELRVLTVHGDRSKRTAQLHLWVGECELAVAEEPEDAIHHFQAAHSMTSQHDPVHGLANYDTAIAYFCQGNYQTAADAFQDLIANRNNEVGVPLGRCEMWRRHASACAGYHAQRSAMGIPEPPRLDPLCAVAAIASGLKVMHRPYDPSTVLKACRATGEGSSMRDIVNAAPKLGIAIHHVQADEKGLVMLPKPLVAFVERDHFVSVVSADNTGVSYLCSDCGAWPGGKVHLTWKQWRAMNPGIYATLTEKDGIWDRALTSLAATQSCTPARRASGDVQVAGPLTGIGLTLQLAQITKMITGHVVANIQVSGPLNCGLKIVTLTCAECVTCCFFHVIGSVFGGDGSVAGPGVGGGSGGGVFGPRLASRPGESGPAFGDPVNIASGEEEYKPAPDLTVYNPIGPSIVWQRAYNCFRSAPGGYNADSAYEANDFGVGWSQTYNVCVFDPSGGLATKYLILDNGARIGFNPAAVPSSGTPTVACSPVQNGVPFLITWNYSALTGGTYFKITWKDRTQWVTTELNSGTSCYALDKIVDRNSNAIHFNYTGGTGGAWQLLSTITDDNDEILLLINRMLDGSGRITSIADRYGRSVYYNVGRAYSPAYQWTELNRVSQIVPIDTPNAADRFSYDYQVLQSGFGSEQLPFLHSITVPSPTGTGSSTARINYQYNPGQTSNTGNGTMVSSVTDANGNRNVFSGIDDYGNESPWSTNTTRVTVRSPQGDLVYKYLVSYDNSMNTTSQSDGAGHVLYTKTYSDPNDFARPSSVTDGNGHTTSYTWDTYGNLLTMTDARGVKTTNTWDYSHFALGELVSTQKSYVDGGGTHYKTATTFEYDEPSGLVTAIHSPTPGTAGTGATVATTLTYDGYGNVLTVTTPGNGTVTSKTFAFSYSSDGTYSQSTAIGQPIAVTDNVGKVTHYRYDTRGNRTTVIDALGNETDMSYNTADQPLVTSLPKTGQTGAGNGSTANAYQYVGGPRESVTVYDESGNQVRQVRYTYGAEGELLSTVGSTEPMTCMFDGVYRVTSLADGNNHATVYSYNSAGYLASVRYPNANTGTGYDIVTFPTYNPLGQPTKRIDGRGIETDYAYSDPENNLTAMTYPTSTALNVSLTWDSFGRRGTMTDSTGSKSYAYDDLDMPTSVATTFTGVSIKTVSYTFNADGSRATMVTPAGTFTYGYDVDGRMVGLTDPYGNLSAWSYLDNGWLTTQTLANSSAATVAETSYTYNALGEMTRLLNKDASNATLSDFSNLAYDGAGNRTSLTASLPGATAYSGTTTYAYDDNGTHDARSQLTSESSTRNGGYSESHAYDAAGNATTFRGAAKSYNADNQLSANTYDGNGNPTTYSSTTCAFDPENRLTAYGSALTAGYDGDGLRAWKSAGGTTTLFLYDGATPVCELDANGNVTATNTFGAHGLLSRTAASVTTLYTFDAHGSVAQRLGANGAISASDCYNAWGTRSSTGGADVFGYGAQWGYYTDNETGLILCTHRYYDPAQGRWLTRDPIGYAGGVNLYGYCGNEPILHVDAEGNAAAILGGILLVCPECGIVAVAIGIGIIIVYVAGRTYRPGLPIHGGPPNGSLSNDNGCGQGQIRDYDGNGDAQTDTDFGHDHNGAGDPHQHDWEPGAGGRGPARPLE